MTDYSRTPRWGVGAGVWFRDDSPLTSTQRLVLWIISLRGNRDTKISHPGVRKIARESKFDERTVRAAVKKLAQLGAIQIIKNPGLADGYRVLHLDWSQDDGVPWVTRNPGHRTRGRRKKEGTPGPGPGGSGLTIREPRVNDPAFKGLNNSLNNSLQSPAHEKPPRASALKAPRGGEPIGRILARSMEGKTCDHAKCGQPWRLVDGEWKCEHTPECVFSGLGNSGGGNSL